MIPICHLWSTDGTQWRTSNWTWSECEMVQEICAVWGTTGVPWFRANWKWSECSGSIVPPIPPIPVVVVVGNQPGVDAETLIPPWQLAEEPWNPYKSGSHDKQKKLIKLICKIKGQSYSEEKEVGDYKVTVGDIRMVVKAVSGIDLDLRLEE